MSDPWRDNLLQGYRLQHSAAAVPFLERAAACRPDHPDAWQLLGLCAAVAGRLDAAAAAMGRHWRIARSEGAAGNYALSLSRAAVADLQAGRSAAAIDRLRRALDLRGEDASCWLALSGALQATDRMDDARAAGRRAVVSAPGLAAAAAGLADVCAVTGDWSSARRLYRRALRIAPDDERAAANLGALSGHAGEASPSLAACRRAVALRPDGAGFWGNLGGAWITAALPKKAARAYGRAARIEPGTPKWLSNRLMSLQYFETSRSALAGEHKRFGAAFGRPTASGAPFAADADPDRPLNVGFLSPDFRRHVTMRFFKPLLQAHDPTAMRMFCYADVERPDEESRRIADAADLWRVTVGLSDAALEAQIRADGVDILVDLAGHSSGRRMGLLARRAAPVTATWLGYPDTTGLPAVDYRIVDGVTDPEGAADGLASEALLRLPQCFLCYQPPDDAPAVGPPPFAEKGVLTFGSFNNLAKISDATIDLWSAALSAAENTRLALKARALADWNVAQRLRAAFTARGIADDRLVLLPWTVGYGDHLAVYNDIDAALDPFPYNGATTTCEALWMGVPVLTLAGDRHAARVGAGLLRQVGLDDFIAESPQGFAARAAALARDAGALGALRGGLRARMASSPLTDAAGFARRMEAALRGVWRRRCAACGGR